MHGGAAREGSMISEGGKKQKVFTTYFDRIYNTEICFVNYNFLHSEHTDIIKMPSLIPVNYMDTDSSPSSTKERSQHVSSISNKRGSPHFKGSPAAPNLNRFPYLNSVDSNTYRAYNTAV